jgi:hypothetical protein
MNNQRGISLILIVSTLGFLSLLMLSNLLMRSLDQQRDWQASLTFANKNHMVYTLGESLANEIALRFSRYDSNQKLQQCLTAMPGPCDETMTYDMQLYAPIEQSSFQGGAWPVAPAGAVLLAGGRIDRPSLYRISGARCPVIDKSKADEFCPLQAIVQFKPLCGGTKEAPEPAIAGGGPCVGPAMGFDITVGVARYMNGILVYHENSGPGGDARTYRFPATLLRN